MRQKLNFLPVFLLLNLPIFVIVLCLLIFTLNIRIEISVYCALFYYLERTINNTKLDYLEDKINELKKK